MEGGAVEAGAVEEDAASRRGRAGRAAPVEVTAPPDGGGRANIAESVGGSADQGLVRTSGAASSARLAGPAGAGGEAEAAFKLAPADRPGETTSVRPAREAVPPPAISTTAARMSSKPAICKRLAPKRKVVPAAGVGNVYPISCPGSLLPQCVLGAARRATLNLEHAGRPNQYSTRPREGRKRSCGGWVPVAYGDGYPLAGRAWRAIRRTIVPSAKPPARSSLCGDELVHLNDLLRRK